MWHAHWNPALAQKKDGGAFLGKMSTQTEKAERTQCSQVSGRRRRIVTLITDLSPVCRHYHFCQ